MEQILAETGERDAYFWATYSGAELDLLLARRGRRWGFEFKYGDAPVMTKSLHSAIEDLKTDHIWVVYPGKRAYELGKRVTAIGLEGLAGAIRKMSGR